MAYIVKKGNKYMHLSAEAGLTWGPKKGAFRFYSEDAAWTVACGVAGKSKVQIETLE